MADTTVSSDIDALLTAADNAAARTALGINAGVPFWGFEASNGADPSGAGKFTTNSATVGATSQLKFYGTLESGSTITTALMGIPKGATLLLAYGAGNVVSFTNNAAPSLTGGVVTFSSVSPVGTGPDWSAGPCYLTVLPPNGVAMTFDTSWGANGSAGDKSISVPAYAAPSFSGTDLVDVSTLAALAVQVQTITSKFLALQDALSKGILPNA